MKTPTDPAPDARAGLTDEELASLPAPLAKAFEIVQRWGTISPHSNPQALAILIAAEVEALMVGARASKAERDAARAELSRWHALALELIDHCETCRDDMLPRDSAQRCCRCQTLLAMASGSRHCSDYDGVRAERDAVQKERDLLRGELGMVHVACERAQAPDATAGPVLTAEQRVAWVVAELAAVRREREGLATQLAGLREAVPAERAAYRAYQIAQEQLDAAGDGDVDYPAALASRDDTAQAFRAALDRTDAALAACEVK